MAQTYDLTGGCGGCGSTVILTNQSNHNAWHDRMDRERYYLHALVTLVVNPQVGLSTEQFNAMEAFSEETVELP